MKYLNLIIDNKELIIDNMKLLVYKSNPDLFYLLEYENSKIFLEPLLFSYFNKNEHSEYSLEHILYGYIIAKKRNFKVNVKFDNNGVLYMPNIGYFLIKKEDICLDFKLCTIHYNNQLKEYSLYINEKEIQFDFLELEYIDIFQVYKFPILMFNDYFHEFHEDKQSLPEKKANVEIVKTTNFHRPNFDYALNIIKSYLPELYTELVHTNNSVVLYYNLNVQCFQLTASLGTIFISCQECNDFVFFLEEIIHQGSHNTLDYLLFNKNIYFKKNLDEVFLKEYSIFEEKFNRTILSAIHGLFTVHQRVKYYKKLIELNIPEKYFSLKQQHEFIGRFCDQKRRFRTGLQFVNANDLYTEKGVELINGIDNDCYLNLKFIEPIYNEFDLSNQKLEFRYCNFLELNPIDEFNYKRIIKKLMLIILFIFNIKFSYSQINKIIIIKDINVVNLNTKKIENVNYVKIVKGKLYKYKNKPLEKFKNYSYINGDGKYLIETLRDMHVHFQDFDSTMTFNKFLLLNLINGVTHIRIMRGDSSQLIIRNKIDSGLLLGPKMEVGLPIVRTNSVKSYFYEFKKNKYDFFKYLGGLNELQFDSICKIADKNNIVILGHTHKKGFLHTINYNFKSVEHFTSVSDFINPNVLKNMNTKFICPTFNFYLYNWDILNRNELFNYEELKYIDLNVVDKWKLEYDIYMKEMRLDSNYNKFIKDSIENYAKIKNFKKYFDDNLSSKFKIIIGSDEYPFSVPGFSLHREINSLVKIGYSNDEIIDFLYKNSDLYYTNTKFQNKNYMIIDENPLENVSNLKKIHSIIYNGNCFTINFLKKKLED